MKKIVSMVLLISFICGLSVNVSAYSGIGTESNPYVITTPKDLMNMKNDLSAHYVLGNNIDMSDAWYEPVGNDIDGAFTGSFDGRGYTISNLDLDLEGTKYVGLFGYLDGTVKNVNLTNVVASGYRYIGGIAGYADNNAKILNCHCSAIIDCLYIEKTVYSGGIVGYSLASVDSCSFSGEVKGSEYGGGIAGYIENACISGCFNYGDIYSKNYSGGVAGFSKGNINNSTNRGTIYVTEYMQSYSQCAGGISGYSYGKISNCYNYGSITSERSAAGSVGGIIGIQSASSITECINYGAINYGRRSGGIIGEITATTDISLCVNIGNVYSFSSQWGMRGTNNYSGGIVGYTTYATFVECANYGNIMAESDKGNFVYSPGGIIGGVYADGNWRTTTIINNCISIGKANINEALPILGSQYYYGSSGDHSYTKINNCISSGKIAKDAPYTSINNCYTIASNNDKCFLTDNQNIDFKNIWEQTVTGEDYKTITLKNLPAHIKLNEYIVFLKKDETKLLKAYIENIQENVLWTSDDESIATVSSTGVVTGINFGTCTISAMNSKGIKTNCLVVVYDEASKISFEKSEYTITINGKITPKVEQIPNEIDEQLYWKSDNNAVAEVDRISGQIKGIKSGYANITATTGNSDISATCVVRVTGSPVTAITLSQTKASINKDKTLQLSTSITPSAYDGQIAWSSSDESIAAVDDTGLITAKYPGICYIYAKAESGITAQCTVTVKAPATGIKLNKTELNLQKGLTERLETSLTPTYSTDEIKWTTSNSNIAAVSIDGTVTAKSVGQSIISAITTSGEKAYCTVNITENPIAVSSVTLNKTSAVLTSADKIQLNATVLPENATDKSIVWKSSDEAVATVSNTGVVTAVSPGNATITATSNNGYYHECNIDVVAANGSAFIAKSTKASAGEIAEYTVSVVKNPGISSYKLNLDYDSSLLTPIEIMKNSQISGSLSSNLKDEARNTLNVIWYSTDDFTENADLFTIKFRVVDNAEYGTEIPITMSSGASDIKNSSGKKLAFFMNNTSIKVEKPLLGDIFEDGEIDFRDLNLLARNVSGLESLSQRQLLAADTEQDKVIDTKDTVRLLQHLTGWTGADLIYTFAMNNGAASVKVGSASINAANEAEIPVSIEYNPGIAGFRFELDYDKNALDILSITPTAAISENFMTNLGTDEKLYVSWYNAENINADGALFTIKVKYKDECDKQVTPISIVAADNNICNQKREDVIAEYETGYLMTDSFVKENEAIENGTYSADVYFDNSYEEKSAVAILALYDKSGKLITLSSKDITVKPGKENISVTLEAAEFDNFKLFIWDSLENLKPIVTVK